MDLEKLEKLANLVLRELESYNYNVPLHEYPELESSFKNLMQIANQTLPEHCEMFNVAYHSVCRNQSPIRSFPAKTVISHMLKIIEIEKRTNIKVKEMKIFEGAEEKLEQAANSFRNDDYCSTFHNLNTALELVLKDKLGIPSTLRGINTANIMDILTKYKVEPYLYLEEARKHVLVIDNKIKHQGYSPTKVESINAVKAVEELLSKLKNSDMKINDELREKIFAGL
jgi:HEPN domain-containing protein